MIYIGAVFKTVASIIFIVINTINLFWETANMSYSSWRIFFLNFFVCNIVLKYSWKSIWKRKWKCMENCICCCYCYISLFVLFNNIVPGVRPDQYRCGLLVTDQDRCGLLVTGCSWLESRYWSKEIPICIFRCYVNSKNTL